MSVELNINCPTHGLERHKIKLIKRVNIASDEIIPKECREYGKPHGPENRLVQTLYIGRNVGAEKVEDFVSSYLRDVGIAERIIYMKINL